MSNIKKYASYEVEAVEADEEQAAQGGSQFLKHKAGQTLALRVLPPKAEWGIATPFAITYQHTIDIPGTKDPVRFNCPRMMAKAPCPACARMEELKSSGNPTDYAEGGKMYPKFRVLANVIDRDHEELGPQVWGFGKKIYEQLTSIRKDPRKGGDFCNPEEDGFDLLVERQGEGLLTKYFVSPARQSSPLGNEDWIDIQTDLRSFKRVDSAADIRKKLGVEEEARAVRQPAPAAAVKGKKTRTAADDMVMTDDDK
jgi:hypothetical protein